MADTLTAVPADTIRAWQAGAWYANLLDALEAYTSELMRRDEPSHPMFGGETWVVMRAANVWHGGRRGCAPEIVSRAFRSFNAAADYAAELDAAACARGDALHLLVARP